MAMRKTTAGKRDRSIRRAAKSRTGMTRAALPKRTTAKRSTASTQDEPRFVGKHIFARAKVSSKGWIVIPKQIRDEMGLRPGDEVSLALWPPPPDMKQDRGLYSLNVGRVPEDPVALGLGMFKRRPGQPSLAEELVKEHRSELEKEERELREWQRRRPQTA